MYSRRGLWVVLCCAFALGGCQHLSDRQRSSSPFLQFANDDVLHVVSGFRFPARQAGFERQQVNVYDESYSDISVGYNALREPVVVTVYVYPAGQRTLTEEFGARQQEVMRVHFGADISDTSSIQITPAHVTARSALFNLVSDFGGLTQRVRSQLIVAKDGPRFVEYRLTYPPGDGAQAAATRFLQTFAWPTYPAADGSAGPAL